MLNVNRSFICIFSDKLKDTALNGLHETKSTLVKEVYVVPFNARQQKIVCQFELT